MFERSSNFSSERLSNNLRHTFRADGVTAGTHGHRPGQAGHHPGQAGHHGDGTHGETPGNLS